MNQIFLDSNGELVKEGSIIKNPQLANTLDLLSKKENVFYIDGQIGIDLVDELTEQVNIYFNWNLIWVYHNFSWNLQEGRTNNIERSAYIFSSGKCFNHSNI